jgi:hypothetical protein
MVAGTRLDDVTCTLLVFLGADLSHIFWQSVLITSPDIAARTKAST